MFKKKNDDKEIKENSEQEKQQPKIETKQESPVDELSLLKAQNQEYLNGWKRAQADYQNLKKEKDRERAEFVKYANANLLMEILPVFDHFKSAFRQIPESEKESAWVVGFSYIKKQLFDFLTANGIEEIKTVGEEFDHNLHEAVEFRESESQKEIILEEVKAGYKLNGKVIQAAKVVVGKAIEQATKQEIS